MAQLKKKEHPKFNVPNFNSKNRKRVPERWRKQRGIDSKKRVKKNFAGAEPTIGYKNPDSIRGIRASGKRAELVHNETELKGIVDSKKNVDIILAKPIGRKKKIALTKIAQKSNLKVVNGVSQ
ncbi:50S ribosomal protein L32e [Candidatus Mancarchaeum acidiphilum]|uniref:50S ribosomal protein L32e n=1 Tax=Candidatus Mancarchaeum acidiphilum TaxID=1920749 RepID=A0A218NLR7_9ARCH|nr:eL32 family ribosomal protein [Candidatus Mancarchaeum acidiphilum]ASI13417.1 50S ribosomal protein L32e [Candidatus Mancarchaeum acidiphilum]